MPFEHPFLVPDILLHITEYIIIRIHDTRERWNALLRILLVNKTAQAILIDRASFWRWVDISSPTQLSLMMQRLAPRRSRPVITYLGMGDTIDLDSRLETVTNDFRHAPPTLQPEALFISSIIKWTDFPASLLDSHVWGDLRMMSLQASIATRLPTVGLPLAFFPKLETLYVVNHVPQMDGDSADFSWPSLLNLAIVSTVAVPSILSDWIHCFNIMPNLRTLALRGPVDVPDGTSSLEIELPVLQSLRIHPWGQSANFYTFNTPQLKRMTLFAPRGHSASLPSLISPRHLVDLVRLLSAHLLTKWDRRFAFFFL